MKWGGYTPQVSERLDRAFRKLAGHKGIYYLLMIATLGLLLGAGAKWSP